MTTRFLFTQEDQLTDDQRAAVIECLFAAAYFVDAKVMEVKHVGERVHRLLAHLEPPAIQEYLKGVRAKVEALSRAADGGSAYYAEAAGRLPSAELREKVLANMILIAAGDGKVDPTETQNVLGYARFLQISDERTIAITGEVKKALQESAPAS